MRVGARGEVHADPARPPYGDHGVRHFKHEPGAILDRSAIAVVALVAAVLQELVKQIAVRAMDLDAVEPRLFRVLGAVTIGLDDVGKLLGFERARGDIRPLRPNETHIALGRDRARGNGKVAAMIDGVGNAPDMPELEKDASAGSMHALDDAAPALDLLVGPDARGMRVADACWRDRGRLGKDKPSGRALRVIVAHHRVRNPAGTGRAIARQWRHDNAVGELQIANLQRVEQHGH
jgi:hypothetical protein